MEKPKYSMAILITVVMLFCLISITACIAAEFKRTKARDLKLDGKLCSLPGSPAFGLGLAASICLLAAQILATSMIACRFCSREKKQSINAREKATALVLFILSWITFGLAIILLGVGTSMNHRQNYGNGWLIGECYVVNDWVYVAAALLVLATLIFILGFAFTARTRLSASHEAQRKVHAQKHGGRRDTGENGKQWIG